MGWRPGSASAGGADPAGGRAGHASRADAAVGRRARDHASAERAGHTDGAMGRWRCARDWAHSAQRRDALGPVGFRRIGSDLANGRRHARYARAWYARAAAGHSRANHDTRAQCRLHAGALGWSAHSVDARVVNPHASRVDASRVDPGLGRGRGDTKPTRRRTSADDARTATRVADGALVGRQFRCRAAGRWKFRGGAVGWRFGCRALAVGQ